MTPLRVLGKEQGAGNVLFGGGTRAEPLDSVRSARIGGYGSVIYRRGATEMMSWELDDLRHRRQPTVPTCDVYSPRRQRSVFSTLFHTVKYLGLLVLNI